MGSSEIIEWYKAGSHMALIKLRERYHFVRNVSHFELSRDTAVKESWLTERRPPRCGPSQRPSSDFQTHVSVDFQRHHGTNEISVAGDDHATDFRVGKRGETE